MDLLQQVNILYINIRSLRHKLDDLRDILNVSEKDFQVIILTETWLYSDEVTYFELPSYAAVHDCRNSRGGGVCIYIKKDIDFYSEDLAFLGQHDCSVVSVHLPGLQYKLCGIYRPPSGDSQTYLNLMDKIMEAQRGPGIVIGDMNLDLLKESHTVSEYKNTIEMNGFEIQNVIASENATRVTSTSATILDHVITNKNIDCKILLEDHVISDHKVMHIKLEKHVISVNKKDKITKETLHIQEWIEKVQRRLQQGNVEDFERLTAIINETKKQCTKKHLIKIRNNNLWVNAEYIEKVRQRDKLYKRWKVLQNAHTEKAFKKLKNEVNNLRLKLKKEYAEKKIQEAGGDTKKVWKVLNELTCRKVQKTNKISEIESMNGEVLKQENDVVEEFNKYFSKIGVNLAAGIPSTPNVDFEEEVIDDTIYLNPTDLYEVKNVVNDLKNNCAPGTDNITKRDIVNLFPVIGEKMVTIINNILTNGIFPEELKIAKVIPVYKKGSHKDLNNYRPISVLNTFSKITEKIIKNRLHRFIENHYKLDPYQYGFQKHSSTLGASVDVLEYISSELDRNKYVLAVFVDLKKAFDTVNIELLLDKLYKMGIRGVGYELMRTYSLERSQFTVVNQSKSKKVQLSVGVAQGSVLGPLQYLLYVHSLKYAGLKSRYFMFADDTVLVLSAEDARDLEVTMNMDLDLYYRWLCHNKLSLNVDKTVCMLIKQKNKPSHSINIVINKMKLKEVTNYKYLGLTITNSLTWSEHTESVIKKIVPIVGAIRRCSKQINMKTRYLLYNGFIEPHIRYLIPCWGNGANYLLDRIQRMQNKAVKTVFSIPYFTSTLQVYNETKVLKIKQLRTLEQVKLIYSIRNKTLKTNLAIGEVGDRHSHDTRTRNKIRNEYKRTRKGQDSPIIRAIQAYNEMPEEIMDVRKLDRMCRLIKVYLRGQIV